MRTRVIVLVLSSLLAVAASAQTVHQRTRLGHVVEDLDTFEKRLVVLDGLEVYRASSKGELELLFDIRSGGADHSTGIVYVPTEKVFLVVTPAALFQLFVFDEKGTPLGTRPITYLGGFTPEHIEAATYLGKDTPYPDHIAFLAYETTLSIPHVEVAKRDGTVVAHIALPPLFAGSAFGMASAGGDHLYVISGPNEIYTLDFTGVIVSGPVRVAEGFAIEGITRVENRIYVRDYFSGKFVALDTSLQRTPTDDLRHDFGLGFGGLLGIGWNSDTDRYLVLANNAENNLGPVGWEMVPTLDEARPRLYTLAHGYQRGRGAVWMPDESKIAVAHPQPQRRILIYSPMGQLLEQIDVTPIGRPSHIAWNPVTDEFYVRVVEMPSAIRVLSRTGAFVRDIDFSSLGTFVVAFAYTGGNLLVFIDGSLYRTDLNGNVLASYDPSALNVIPGSITAITTGPDAGRFAIAAQRNCELVVFSLP